MTIVARADRRATPRVELTESPAAYAALLAPDLTGTPAVLENARCVATDADHRRVLDWARDRIAAGGRFAVLAESELRAT